MSRLTTLDCTTYYMLMMVLMTLTTTIQRVVVWLLWRIVSSPIHCRRYHVLIKGSIIMRACKRRTDIIAVHKLCLLWLRCSYCLHVERRLSGRLYYEWDIWTFENHCFVIVTQFRDHGTVNREKLRLSCFAAVSNLGHVHSFFVVPVHSDELMDAWL